MTLSLNDITNALTAAEKAQKGLLVEWLTPNGDRKYNRLEGIVGDRLSLRADSQSYGVNYSVTPEQVLSVEQGGPTPQAARRRVNDFYRRHYR